MSNAAETHTIAAPVANPVRGHNPNVAAVSLLRWLRRAAPPLLFLVTGALAWMELKGFDFAALRSSVSQVPIPALLGLQALALVGVFEMTLYDWWVSRWLKVPIAPARLMRYSWVANATNNLIGLSGLAGSGIRILLLTRDGVSGRTASVYSGTVMLSVPVGLSVLVIFALLTGRADSLPAALPAWAVRLVLIAYGAYLLVFVALGLSRGVLRRVLHSETWLGLRGSLVLIAISVLDWLLAVAVAWACLLASGGTLPLDAYLAAFAFSATLGILSLIPGGLGVFDASLLAMLSAAGVAPSAAAASLLLFRVIYYLVPWLIGVYLGTGLLTSAGGTVAGLAKRWQDSPVLGLLRLPVELLTGLGIRLLGWLTFATGLVLLISAALPSVQERVDLVLQFVPRNAVELSHFLSVGVGVLLVALSRGIGQQVRNAYRVTMPLLLAGAALSLIKGANLESASFLLAVAGLLWMRRDAFYRLSYPLLSRRSLLWLSGLAASIVAYWLVGAWAHRQELAETGIWVLADPTQHAGRWLRAVPLLVVVPIGWLAWGYFRMPRPDLSPPTAQALDEAKTWMEANGGGSFAHLAFLGDKHLLYAADGRCLIQVGRVRNRLVALGDPIGPEDALAAAICDFRDLADRYALDPVLYEVSDRHLHVYHDTGFVLFKVGEMALVRVADFKLTGKRNENLRYGVNRARRDGASVQRLDHPLNEATWAELKAVSDAWLKERGAAEKRFSLGAFDREYLSRSPIFAVRREGAILAFASVMPAYRGRDELGADLMRQLPGAPVGIMDLLFAEMIEYARTEGYEWFNLGMAPMSGVGKHRFARPDERLAALAYDYGNRLYNYKGLRSFKAKFHPQWQGRYIAYPLFTPLPTLLVDIAALIAGGYRQILWRP